MINQFLDYMRNYEDSKSYTDELISYYSDKKKFYYDRIKDIIYDHSKGNDIDSIIKSTEIDY